MAGSSTNRFAPAPIEGFTVPENAKGFKTSPKYLTNLSSPLLASMTNLGSRSRVFKLLTSPVSQVVAKAQPSLEAADEAFSEATLFVWQQGPVAAGKVAMEKTPQIVENASSMCRDRLVALAAISREKITTVQPMKWIESAYASALQYYAMSTQRSDTGLRKQSSGLAKFIGAIRQDLGSTWDERLISPLTDLYKEIDTAAHDDFVDLYSTLDRDQDGTISVADLQSLSKAMVRSLRLWAKKARNSIDHSIAKGWQLILQILLRFVDFVLPPEPTIVYTKPKTLAHQVTPGLLSSAKLKRFDHKLQHHEDLTFRDVLEITLHRLSLLIQSLHAKFRNIGQWIASYIKYDPFESLEKIITAILVAAAGGIGTLAKLASPLFSALRRIGSFLFSLGGESFEACFNVLYYIADSTVALCMFSVGALWAPIESIKKAKSFLSNKYTMTKQTLQAYYAATLKFTTSIPQRVNNYIMVVVQRGKNAVSYAVSIPTNVYNQMMQMWQRRSEIVSEAAIRADKVTKETSSVSVYYRMRDAAEQRFTPVYQNIRGRVVYIAAIPQRLLAKYLKPANFRFASSLEAYEIQWFSFDIKLVDDSKKVSRKYQ